MTTSSPIIAPKQRIAALERQLAERTRERDEARLQAAEANRLKTEFLARMSHDLRTPMNAIIGYARLLLRKLKGQIDDRQYQNLENIQISAHHLLDLINDILDLSKVETGRVEIRLETIDLKGLFDECLAKIAPLVKPGIELRQQIDGITTLHTDPARLSRAIKNLLNNAAKFTDTGAITLSARRTDTGLEIAVTDTGAGIPPAELPHIFDTFRQVARKGRSAEQGTGLGLAIVERSVELIGGTVAVESREGEGTTFTIALPT